VCNYRLWYLSRRNKLNGFVDHVGTTLHNEDIKSTLEKKLKFVSFVSGRFYPVCLSVCLSVCLCLCVCMFAFKLFVSLKGVLGYCRRVTEVGQQYGDKNCTERSRSAYGKASALISNYNFFMFHGIFFQERAWYDGGENKRCQTDRWKDVQTDSQIDRQTNGQMDKQTGRQASRQAGRQAGR